MSENASREAIAVPPSTQHRCICCGGVIEIPPDQDLSLGLSLSLGLVSDECALICTACTSRLIEARQRRRP
jgi:hypothetical protein